MDEHTVIKTFRIKEELSTMSKSLSKVLVLLLAVMLMGLAACGVSNSNATTEESAAKTENVPAADEIAEAPAGGLSAAQVGDVITFGTYEQDGDMENGAEPIEWLVLDRDDDRILVLSRYGLDCQTYHPRLENVTWQSCALRTWLNDKFLSTAFSSSEQAMIPTVTITAEDEVLYKDGAGYIIDPGEDTQDKVFALSIAEAQIYLGNSWFEKGSDNNDYPNAYCKATPHAISQGLWVVDYDGDAAEWAKEAWDGNCFWWLRGPAICNLGVANVDYYGAIYTSYYNGGLTTGAVRPALWICLTA